MQLWTGVLEMQGGAGEGGVHHPDSVRFKNAVQISNSTHVQKATEPRSYQQEFLNDDGVPSYRNF
jgi:hypothetical protein